MTAVEIRAALEGLLKVLETFAKYTPNHWDDQLTEVVRNLLAVPALFELLAFLLGDREVQTLRDEARTERIQTLAAAQQVPHIALQSWPIVMRFLPLIVRLLLSALGRR